MNKQVKIRAFFDCKNIHVVDVPPICVAIIPNDIAVEAGSAGGEFSIGSNYS
jgi:hypothetical protein